MSQNGKLHQEYACAGRAWVFFLQSIYLWLSAATARLGTSIIGNTTSHLHVAGLRSIFAPSIFPQVQPQYILLVNLFRFLSSNFSGSSLIRLSYYYCLTGFQSTNRVAFWFFSPSRKEIFGARRVLFLFFFSHLQATTNIQYQHRISTPTHTSKMRCSVLFTSALSASTVIAAPTWPAFSKSVHMPAQLETMSSWFNALARVVQDGRSSPRAPVCDLSSVKLRKHQPFPKPIRKSVPPH